MDLLITLLAIPALGALLLSLLRGGRSVDALARQIAAVIALLTLLFALGLGLVFDLTQPTIQLLSLHQWNARLGTHVALGIDGLSYALVLLTTLLVFLAITVSASITRQARSYYALLLLLEAATLGVFIAQDWALFYLFWELVLIPLFFLINRWGSAHREPAALNFVLYTMGGSVFMLLSLLLLFDANPEHSFLFESINRSANQLDPETQLLIFTGLLIGFGVKLPLFPLHGWLPGADVEAPGPVSMLLSGILLKMGGYGLLRAITALPAAAIALQDVMALLGVIGMVYGGLLAWQQTDLRRIVAYASISHMGLVIVGIASLNVTGLLGAGVQMVAHGLVAATLFLLVTLIYERTGTRLLGDYGSLLTVAPRFALLTTTALLAGIGLPGSVGFVAEIQILTGSYQQWHGWAAFLLTAVILGSLYSLQTIRQLCTGPANPQQATIADLNGRETLAAGVLIVLTILLGFYPEPLLNLLEAPLQQLADQLAATGHTGGH